MNTPAEAPGEGLDAGRRNSEVLGEILWLFAHSPMHRGMRLIDLERYVFPALQHGRYRLYKRNGMPIGYVAIAKLSKEVEDLWLAGGYTLQADDWISGDRFWIMQLVVPFGDGTAVLKKIWFEPELRRKRVWALRPNRTGPGLKVVQYGQLRYRDRNPIRRLINAHLPRVSAPRPPSESTGASAPARRAPQTV